MSVFETKIWPFLFFFKENLYIFIFQINFFQIVFWYWNLFAFETEYIFFFSTNIFFIFQSEFLLFFTEFFITRKIKICLILCSTLAIIHKNHIKTERGWGEKGLYILNWDRADKIWFILFAETTTRCRSTKTGSKTFYQRSEALYFFIAGEKYQ